MTIQLNSVVALTYDLYTNENGQEVFVERADEQNPLVFLYGVGMMLPKFEENLSGLLAGDAYDFQLVAEDAYGLKDENAITELPLDMFGNMEMPEIGSILPLQDNEGNQFRARVHEISDSAVTVDLNHPMAGQDLRFIGKIISVRPATSEELAHGHAHGADGHQGH
ncbi:peptidylprolyl isomerase [Daejeonella sp. H1SJ63]|jgi:FKBP-type peptidyl-prolyl cis-trans isomerase SlyD|uniref:FKBP-type peptidyl-prolyl cis-trans isomerase n=1 Tax=Daejeonella sp. H1SJ63 TaxID=3034145 RepID=UPI0023ECF551|nr:peptidylprolyl isomerase [Daejeonella sp. H1SJ63]